MRTYTSRLDRSYKIAGYTMVAPALFFIAIVTLFPIGYSIWMSLNNIQSSQNGFHFSFTGLTNYKIVFNSSLFYQALIFTIVYAIVTVVVELILGLLVALAINQPIKGRGIAIAVMLIPWTLITVISAQMWGYIYNGIYGVLDYLLQSLHLINSSIVWLGIPNLATISIMIADIWKTTPFVTMILLAGLQLIPADLYEAAKIDGAGAFRSFFSVTLPLLKSSLALAALFRILQAFGLFDLPFVLTGGGPGTSTMSIAMLAYKAIFNDFEYGPGTAVAVITVIIILIMSLISIKAFRAQVGDVEE